MSMLFRPQDLPKRYLIKERRRSGKVVNYNFVDNAKWYPAGWKVNHQFLGRVHSKLHYLACHSPEPVQKKWEDVYERFYLTHFGSRKATVRYLNKWSCHSWM